MKVIFVITSTLFSLSLFSCATLSREGSKVQQLAAISSSSCMYIKPVEGSTAAAVGANPWEIATMDIKNETAKAGGNFFSVTKDNSSNLFGKIYGDAYFCNSNASTAVLQQPQPAEQNQIANQLQRQNDILEKQQQQNAMQNFLNSLPQNRQPTSQPQQNYNCNTTYNSYFKSFDSHCTGN